MLKVLLAIIALLMSIFSIGQVNEIQKYSPANYELHHEIVKMDSVFFTAYNTCDMKRQANILSEDLEFFHDKGGLSTSKQEILTSLEKNICNKVTRTLIKGSVEVYPIANYGAVQIGYHKFFNKLEPDEKSIPSKFITIWKKENKKWKITRVVSLHN